MNATQAILKAFGLESKIKYHLTAADAAEFEAAEWKPSKSGKSKWLLSEGYLFLKPADYTCKEDTPVEISELPNGGTAFWLRG